MKKINHKRQQTQRFIIEETIKEKPHNFLRDRMSTNGSSKTQRYKYDLQYLFSLSPMRYSWVSVCDKQRGSLSIYTSFQLDNNLLGPTSLGESNNPSSPQLWELFPQHKKGWLMSMTLHDLVRLIIIPIGTSGTNEIQYIKYKSEYISKL